MKINLRKSGRAPKKLNAKEHGDVFFISFPLAGGISVP
jgi:hypothetical protein